MQTTPRVDRPVFIVGPHRSGTSVLYSLLGRHPHVGYFNRLAKRLPEWPRTCARAPSIGFSDHPVEAQPVWDRWRSGDSDVRTAADAPPEITAWYRRVIARTLAQRRTTRFVAKYPRLSFRLPWLEAVFPGAFYIHLDRDWRAVVRSTAARHARRVGRERSWFGVHPPGWRAWRDESFERIATRQYAATVEELERHRARVGERWIHIRYDELCAVPMATMKDLLHRVGLPWTDGFAHAVEAAGIRSQDHKWRTLLTVDDVERLKTVAPGTLSRHEWDGPVTLGRPTRVPLSGDTRPAVA